MVGKVDPTHPGPGKPHHLALPTPIDNPVPEPASLRGHRQRHKPEDGAAVAAAVAPKETAMGPGHHLPPPGEKVQPAAPTAAEAAAEVAAGKAATASPVPPVQAPIAAATAATPGAAPAPRPKPNKDAASK